jgi:hypothetical protein
MKAINNQLATVCLNFTFVLCLSLSVVCVRAQERTSAIGAPDGEKLEREMADDIKAKNWSAVEAKIADGFNQFIQMESEIEPVKLRS